MSGTQVLARKWRPRNFPELVGQDHVVRALTHALETGRLHHAYLLTGTRGVGKTTVARILAKALNCEAGVTASPCGSCAACREIDEGRFVDLIELDAASNTQVDQMRELLENALYAPTAGRFKVYIIDEVHMLSRNAFNAMLKTLEEPPGHVKFVLATTDPQKIPVTVLSRCLQFSLKHIPPALIVERLRQILETEGVRYEAPALQLIGRAAQGSLRDALSLTDQAMAHGGGQVAEASARAMLGAVDREHVCALLDALRDRDAGALMAAADGMEQQSLSFDAALQDLAALLTRVALAQAAPEALEEDLPERARVLAWAGAFPAEDVQLYYEIAVNGRASLELAPDEYAGFTMTLLRMLAFAPAGSTTEQATRQRERPKETGAGPRAAAVPPRVAQAPAAPGLEAGWPAFVAGLEVKGMALMLAQHCELIAFRGDLMELGVPAAHRHLAEKNYEERLRAAIGEALGRAIRLRISIGEGSGLTPAALESREKAARQQEAVESLEQDPFVRDVVEQFEARLIDSSIRPSQ